MKIIIIILLLVGVIISTTACSSQKSENKSKAQKSASKKLVIYTSTATELLNPIISEFETKTGISTEVVTATTGELLKRIESEQANPLGDVEWGGVVSVISPKQNLFENYKSSNESSVIDSCKNTEGMITRFSILPSVFLVNKKLIGDIKIDGYEDLLNPKLKGKIAIADPAKSSASFQHVVNMLYAMGNGNPDNGWDFVDKLCKNLDGKLLDSSAAVTKEVADGEYVVGLTHEEYALQCIKEGANVEIVYMKEGTTVVPDTVQIIKGAKNMDNAKKFVDFLTSKETQTLMAAKFKKRSVRNDVAADSILKPIDQIKALQIDQKTILSSNQAWLHKFKDICDGK
ncbi:MAG: extracellular solute-binding protein [Clostridiaceae bacterium]|nr:extracellular solute-binding protein [Clostridiaceae bacterium]